MKITEDNFTITTIYFDGQFWCALIEQCRNGKNFAGQNDDYFNWYFKTDGASRLASILFEEATDVNIFSGCAVNPAHQNNSSLSISLKMKLVDELIDVLKKLNKTVKVTYY